MPLDLSKVAPQIEAMVGKMSSGLEERQRRLTTALELMDQQAAGLESLKKKIEDSKTTWLVAGLTDGIAGRTASPSPPADFTVIATDGSHIEVDRHQAARCFLLNISHVLLRYGQKPDAVLESEPHLYADQTELVIMPPGQGREQFIEGNLLGAKRSVEECRHLAEMAAALPAGSPAVALLDGTLMLWGLESYPDFVTDVLLDKGLVREFDRLLGIGKEKTLAFGSYISAPRSTDVVNALRVAVCPHEVANCDEYCRAGSRACDSVATLTDAELFSGLLSAGERSDVFYSRSKIVKEHYLDHSIKFFYLRLDEEVARIEMPAWVAEDNARLGLMHSLVVDQCRRGNAYPVALSEAHEQAVVTGADRQNFWQLVEAGMAEERLFTPSTGKGMSKKTRWV